MENLLSDAGAPDASLTRAKAENATLLKRIQRAEMERDEAKAKAKGTNRITLKVSQKGALSVYGLQRWPVTLYREQWLRLLEKADDIRQFIVDNDAGLVVKE